MGLRDYAVIGEYSSRRGGGAGGQQARLCWRVGRTDCPPRAVHDLAGAARRVLIYASRCKPLLLLAIGDAVALDRFLDGGLSIRRIDPSNLDGRRPLDARDRPGVRRGGRGPLGHGRNIATGLAGTGCPLNSAGPAPARPPRSSRATRNGVNPSLTLARQKDGQASRVLSPGRLLQRSGVLLCAAPAASLCVGFAFPATTF